MTTANDRLRGRTIVLTGASSGLGLALAEGLSRQGATLVLAARRKERLEAIAARLPGVKAVACDVSVQADRVRLIETAMLLQGRVDGLVNNAGITNVVSALKETVDGFRDILETNLVAPFALAQLAATQMRNQGQGSIVNVSSIMADRSVAQVPEAGYVASKAGLSGLTRELASQWARFGIRVNAISPGFIPSEITTVDDTTAPEWLTEAIPLGRLGRPDEVVAATAFLLSDESSYVTGQAINIDGGMTTR